MVTLDESHRFLGGRTHSSAWWFRNLLWARSNRRPGPANRVEPHQFDSEWGQLSAGCERNHREFHQQPKQPVVSTPCLCTRLLGPRKDLSIQRLGSAATAIQVSGDRRLCRLARQESLSAQRRESDSARPNGDSRRHHSAYW